MDPIISGVIDLAIAKQASDILLISGLPPYIRIDGNLLMVQNVAASSPDTINLIVQSLLTPEKQQLLLTQKEVDFSFSHQNVRFRANAYYQRSNLSLALRLIQGKVKTFQELGLPPIVQRFTQAKRGLVVVCGPTGHGKSTTLASFVDDINTNQNGHIITIEDPIEYVFEHKKCVVSQREVGTDTNSFARALRSAVREDPNVIMVGEIRDYESVETALLLAETGHLVLTTLHTNSASESADRLINLFPAYLQASVRQQLSNVLLGLISQRLVPKVGGGRVMAAEILVTNPAVRSVIREGKTHQLDNVIATSASEGMLSLDKVLAEYISRGDITLDDGLNWANDPKAIKTMLY